MLIKNMTVITMNIQIESKSENDIIDITDLELKIIKESKIEKWRGHSFCSRFDCSNHNHRV